MAHPITAGRMAELVRNQLGFSYLAMLFIVAVLGVTLTKTYEVSGTIAKREKEKELYFVGNQYSQALTSYYNQSPGGFKELPKTLDDLLSDNRFVETKRHLRKRFLDPMTGEDWGVVLNADNRIEAVYSLSDGQVLQTALFADKKLATAAVSENAAPIIYSEIKFTKFKYGDQAAEDSGKSGMVFQKEVDEDALQEADVDNSPVDEIDNDF